MLSLPSLYGDPPTALAIAIVLKGSHGTPLAKNSIRYYRFLMLEASFGDKKILDQSKNSSLLFGIFIQIDLIYAYSIGSFSCVMFLYDLLNRL